MKEAIFTIVCDNYFHYAKTLHESLENTNPNIDRFTFLIGSVSDESNSTLINELVLDIPNRESFFFKYNIIEASTAIKPFCFQHLFKLGYDRITYLDPDIYVYKKLELSGDLTLTRHTNNVDSDNHDIFLRSGVFNLGFISLTQKSLPFLNWWKEKLITHCYNQQSEGLFVDQKWIDIATQYFKPTIIEDDSYNIAYWNVTERDVEPTFFHFSGISNNNFTKYLDIKYKDIRPEYRKSCKDYLEKLIHNNKTYDAIPYKYSKFKDGQVITQENRDVLKKQSVSNPFDSERNIFLLSDSTNYGFYTKETPLFDKYIWMSDCGLVKIPQAGNVKIYGIHDTSFYGAATISIRLNDKAVHETKVQDGNFIVKLNCSEAGILEIKSTFFIPSEKGMSNDIRKLSVRVQKITVDDKSVVDFSRKPPIETKINHGINLFGYEHSTGVGQAARYFDLINYNKSLNKIGESSSYNYNTNLFFMNGNSPIENVIPSSVRYRKYNIGYWHWELASYPNWDSSNYDEIWCSSSFCQDSLSGGLKIPCIKIPYPISFKAEAPNKAMFGLDNKFTFLFIYDSKSKQDRKNPYAVIKAFQLANLDANLIIKTNEPLKNDDSRVKVITEEYSREKIYRLQNSCDCFISLHRSEGFGLNIAECMFLDKPVIVTGYGGNMDFTNHKNSFLIDYNLINVQKENLPYTTNNHWAEPDIEQAAHYMKKVFSGHKTHEQPSKIIKEQYSVDKISLLVYNRIKAIQ